jgi:hypothetical protein
MASVAVGLIVVVGLAGLTIVLVRRGRAATPHRAGSAYSRRAAVRARLAEAEQFEDERRYRERQHRRLQSSS